MAEEILASVAVLTFNAQPFLEQLLDSLFGQETDFVFEVIVIDSGSRDATLEIARRYPVRLYEIANRDFNHGETRNYAASLAGGDFVAYLTQDAIPAHRRWLTEIVRPLREDSRIACVFGRQIAHANAFILTKRDMETHFANMSPDNESVVVQYKGDIPEAEYATDRFRYYFFSNVNSCVRRSVWEQIPFRRIDYAEDQALGMDIIEAGLRKAYSPKAAVIHSHDYRLTEYLQRQFDEYRGLKISIGYADSSPALTLARCALHGIRTDFAYIRQQEGLVPRDLARALVLNCYRMLGIYLGSRHEKLPAALKKKLSLESSVKKRNAGEAPHGA